MIWRSRFSQEFFLFINNSHPKSRRVSIFQKHTKHRRNIVTIEGRKQQYIAQIQHINDPTVRRTSILKGMEKLVEEFGNESEKFGTQFGLYPLWAAFDIAPRGSL